jgi:hypothetical protein
VGVNCRFVKTIKLEIIMSENNAFLSSKPAPFKSGFGIPSAAQPRTLGKARNGDYDGKELGPSTDRPGAMDAYKLPSRIGETRHYPGGKKEAAR